MSDLALGVAVLAVFGILWLISQEWLDALPRRAVRRISTGCLLVLAVVYWVSPTAFDAGVRQFVDHGVAAAQDQFQDALEAVPRPSVPPHQPAPTGSPAPA